MESFARTYMVYVASLRELTFVADRIATAGPGFYRHERTVGVFGRRRPKRKNGHVELNGEIWFPLRCQQLSLIQISA
ncbi:MAG: hypothetical protein K2L33_02515, partial [Muribaculaceae bacterium]|nr:hypothetical protein [Muribaculaceae bacterium]